MRILQNTAPRVVAGVTFGPGGQTLIAGGSGGFNVWDLSTGAGTFLKSHSTKYVWACTCDPLGRWLYFSDSLGGCRLIDLSGHGYRRLPGSPYVHHVVGLAVSPDGQRLVVSRGGASDNRLECWTITPGGDFASVWSLCNGQPIPADEPFLLNQSSWFAYAVAFSHDGRMIATNERRGEAGRTHERPALAVRNTESGATVTEIGGTSFGFGTRIEYAPDGRTLFTWSDQKVEVWDLTNGKCVGQLPAPGRAYFRNLAVHPSGKFFLTVAGDGQVRYWDPNTLAQLRSLTWGIGKLHSVAFSRDGTLAAAGGDKGRVVVWDVDL